MSPDTTPSYRNPQTPLSSLVILPLDLVTIIRLIELFKDILMTVKAIPGTIDTSKATKP